MGLFDDFWHTACPSTFWLLFFIFLGLTAPLQNGANEPLPILPRLLTLILIVILPMNPPKKHSTFNVQGRRYECFPWKLGVEC
jgi:hypothetical protein